MKKINFTHYVKESKLPEVEKLTTEDTRDYHLEDLNSFQLLNKEKVKFIMGELEKGKFRTSCGFKSYKDKNGKIQQQLVEVCIIPNQ